MVSEVWYLLRKDLLLELRRMHHLNGMLLFVLGTVFMCFLSFQPGLEPEKWNALFWIIQLFAAVHATGHSFSGEHPNRHIYYYSIASPGAILLSKTIYNFILLFITGMGSYGVFWLLLGSPVSNVPGFIVTIVIAALGFSSILTLVAAIAWRSEHHFSLMAILSFPVMYPFMIALIKTSLIWVGNGGAQSLPGLMLLLILISFLALALAFILFPYLWKE
ncbi:MAG: heme exporter protein CcmB [Bacteroidota bacterium]|nr:heme exporter protein CcmB [Bacteroidota bacterium]